MLMLTARLFARRRPAARDGRPAALRRDLRHEAFSRAERGRPDGRPDLRCGGRPRAGGPPSQNSNVTTGERTMAAPSRGACHGLTQPRASARPKSRLTHAQGRRSVRPRSSRVLWTAACGARSAADSRFPRPGTEDRRDVSYEPRGGPADGRAPCRHHRHRGRWSRHRRRGGDRRPG